MKLIVGINKIIIEEKDKLNAGEYNIHDIEFEFDEAYNGLTKKATFYSNVGNYVKDIQNGSCVIPYEVLESNGTIGFGVYAYETSGTDLVLRYSPSPVYINVDLGSYRENFDNYKQPTADEIEQFTERLETVEEEVGTYSGRIETLEDGKVDKVDGKGLSTNDYTDEEQTKLSNIEDNAEVNVIEDIKVNGTSQTVTNKTVNITVPDTSGFITKDANNLTYYTLKTNTGSLIDLEINGTTYVVTLSLKDQDGNVISTDTIDLPLESVVIGGTFDSLNKKIVLTLENGNTVDIPVGDLVAGLQTELSSSNKLNADYVSDTNSGNKFTNTSEKNSWNAKYDKPAGGIPKTDLASTVQASLDKADSAIQDVSGKEDKSNKVTSISSSSTDTQYPSAKCMYDSQEAQNTNINTLKNVINNIYDLENILPSSTVTSDNDISINNTMKNAPLKIGLKGNIGQDAISKNKLRYTLNDLKSLNTAGVWNNNVYSYNNMTFTLNSDMSITVSGTASVNTAFALVGLSNQYADLNIENGSYKINGSTEGALETWCIYFAIKNSSSVITNYYVNSDLEFTKSTGDTYFVAVRIGANTNLNRTFYPMIRKSTDDSTYIPYTTSPLPDYPQNIHNVTGDNTITISNSDNSSSQTYPVNLGNIELCEIGDYQDYIYKNSSDSKWYKYNSVAKITSYNGETITADYISTTGGLDTGATVYYGLTTATTTEITDTTLKSQLEALLQAVSYENKTNISQTNDDKPFILDVKALLKLQ